MFSGIMQKSVRRSQKGVLQCNHVLLYYIFWVHMFLVNCSTTFQRPVHIKRKHYVRSIILPARLEEKKSKKVIILPGKILDASDLVDVVLDELGVVELHLPVPETVHSPDESIKSLFFFIQKQSLYLTLTTSFNLGLVCGIRKL